MLLKDKLKNFFNKNHTDKIKLPLMDGFVDIKGYKDGKLFYHDCGDNVVTDWMRQAILTMLAGVSYTKLGDAPVFESNGTRCGLEANPDGYCFNGKQYDELINENEQVKYCSPWKEDCKYACFPTKVLFGTGKEYTDWATLRSENASTNVDWYEDMVNTYGGESSCEANFNRNIQSVAEGDAGSLNDFSGTITNGVYSGDGKIARCRTVNDPNTSTTEVASAVSMYRNYGVIGAVKTPYVKGVSDYANMLLNTTSDSGKLLKPTYRGVGKPAFIYFNQHQKNPTVKEEDWGSEAAEVYISKEKDNKHLTKITFTIILPEQSAGSSSAGKYYPYNGFTLKQIGLYNDSQIMADPEKQPTADDGAYFPWNNMQHGTLLAIKNIAPFTKTSSSTFTISWTLTI